MATAMAGCAIRKPAKHKAAQEAQNACARIVVLAEKKIGQEIIAAQQRGELATDGRPKTVPSGNGFPATHDDIGIIRRQAFEFRQMAALSDDDIVEVMEAPMTQADLRRLTSARSSRLLRPSRSARSSSSSASAGGRAATSR